MHLSRLFIAITAALALAGSTTVQAALTLGNQAISLAFSDKSGGITQIENRLTSSNEQIDDRVFEIEFMDKNLTGTGTIISASDCKLTTLSCDQTSVNVEFAHPLAVVGVSYHLAPDDAFAVKQLRIRSTQTGPWAVRRCALFDWAFTDATPKAIPYYGSMKPTVAEPEYPGQEMPPADTSTAFFFRQPAGGVFTSVSSDFVFMQKETTGPRCRSTYWPGLVLKADQEFLSERGIIGSYKRVGYFHEPYHPTAQLKQFSSANVDIRLDRAEIDAVSAAVRKFIRPDINYTLVNGWGLGVPHLIDSQQAADALKAAIDVAKRIPGLQAVHFVHGIGGLAEHFRLKGLATKPEPNEFVKQIYEYAQKAGLSLSIFVGISNNFPMQKTEKNVLLANRELLNEKENGMREGGRIAISRQYTDFLRKMVEGLVAKYRIGGLTFDFLHIGQDYDLGHEYLPGRPSLYAQWWNVRDMLRKLRQRFPSMMLRGQVGWIHLGAWFSETLSMCHNSGDHNPQNLRNFLDFHIDHQFANNIRLSNWFSNNCRMYPRYKMDSNSLHNGGTYRAWDYGAFEYCILSQMATSQIFGMFHNLPDELNGEVWREQNAEFFKHWLAWHKAHGGYYQREADLFGEPSPEGVDGYAYGNGRDSIVFLCNPTYQAHTVAVPVDATTHLPEGKSYVVRELYPEERNRTGSEDGVFPYGTEFVTQVPAQTVMVFEVKPYAADKPLLTGIAGEAILTTAGIEISSITGPVGEERIAAIRLPEGYTGSESIKVQGREAETKRSGKLLVTRIRFAGDEIVPVISNWRAVNSGGKTHITADFSVPAAARDILQRQKLPVSHVFDTPERRQDAAWLDWSRFIVYVPGCPVGVEPNEAQARQVEKLGDKMQATGSFNGKSVPVHINWIGQKETGKCRFAGYFLDLGESVRYGAANQLELELPETLPGQFGGLFLPNLSRETTATFTVLAPPTALSKEKTLATPAYAPNPVVPADQTSMTVSLRLHIRSQRGSVLNLERDLSVTEGKLLNIRTTADRRWRAPEPEATSNIIVLGPRPTDIYVDIAGNRSTALKIGSGAEAWSGTLGELLAAWKKADDPFLHEMKAFALAQQKTQVEVDLWAPVMELTRVQE